MPAYLSAIPFKDDRHFRLAADHRAFIAFVVCRLLKVDAHDLFEDLVENARSGCLRTRKPLALGLQALTPARRNPSP